MLKLIKYVMPALILAAVAGTAKAQGEMTLVSADALNASSYILKESVRMSGSYTVKCSARPPYSETSVAYLTEKLSVKHASEIGVFVRFTEKAVELHKFQLQILARNKVVFETKQECAGCLKTYAAAGNNDPKSGYLFLMNEEAAQLAEKFLQAKNTVRLKVTGHNGGVATFYFVNARDYKAGSPPVK